MKIEDCKKLRTKWQRTDFLEGQGGPQDISLAKRRFKIEVRGLDGKFQTMIKDIGNIQKEVDRRYAKILPVLDQLVKLQADYARFKKKDPDRAGKILAELESLYRHFLQLKKLFDAAQRKGVDIYVDRIVPLLLGIL